MTLAEHRNELIDYMPEEVQYEHKFDTPPTWLNDKINEAYRDIHMDHVMTDIVETNAIAAGNYYIDLPANFWGMESVGYSTDGVTYNPLLAMQVPSHFRPTSTGTATRYAILPSNKLILDYVAGSAFYLRYVYFTTHTSLSSDTSESTLMEEIHPVILNYCLQRMFRRLGMRNEALDCERLYDKDRARLIRRLGERNAEQAPQENPLVEVGGDGVRYRLYPGGPWSD